MPHKDINIVGSYKQAENEGRYLDAFNLRVLETHTLSKVPNNGHAYWSHQCLQKAQEAGQLNSIGSALGVGPNPFHGRPKDSPAGGAFQQYHVKNGVLYLGDNPY